MKKITLFKKKFDDKELKRLFAKESDCENTVSGEFALYDGDTNQLVALCAKIKDKQSSDNLRSACLHLDNWTVASRGSGLLTTAKVFGYQPRSPIRQRPFCHKGVLSREQPKINQAFVDFSNYAQKEFIENCGEHAQKQLEMMKEKVKPEWRMNGTMYTSGIANNNNPLAYHRDRGNFESFWSAMAVFKKDISGGNLIVKDYDVKIDFEDDSIFFFNGQLWWHGVTPIIKNSKSAYRFTIVYYALKEMWKCMTIEDELAHAIKLRQETEIKRMRKTKK